MRATYLITFLIAISMSQSLTAQLEIWKNDLTSINSNLIDLKFTVKNIGSEEALFHWQIETNQDSESTWSINSIYDLIICYPGDITSSYCSQNSVNALGPDESYDFVSIKILKDEPFEDGCLTFRLLDACVEEVTDTLAEITCKFSSDALSDISETNLPREIVIYPNPTSDLFGLNNDLEISRMRMYDVNGNYVKSVSHRPGQIHDVSELEMGLYFLELTEMGGGLIAVERLVVN